MRSLLREALRSDLDKKLAAMSPDERLALAFRIGEQDLDFYRAARGLERDAARRLLRQQRQRGRRRADSFA